MVKDEYPEPKSLSPELAEQLKVEMGLVKGPAVVIVVDIAELRKKDPGVVFGVPGKIETVQAEEGMGAGAPLVAVQSFAFSCMQNPEHQPPRNKIGVDASGNPVTSPPAFTTRHFWDGSRWVCMHVKCP